MVDAKLGALEGLIGALGFWASAADVLTRFHRAPSLTDDEERRLQLAVYAGLRIGEPLLRAEDEADHDARIQRATREIELLRLSMIGLRWATGPGFSVEALGRIEMPSLADAFGRGAIPRLEEGDLYTANILRGALHRWLYIGRMQMSVEPLDVISYLMDPALPAEVYTAAFSGLEAAACFTAMTLVVTTHRDVRPRIAATLAERWILGQGRLLRLVASLPGAEVPEQIVPADGRFDLERLFAEAATNLGLPAEPATPAK